MTCDSIFELFVYVILCESFKPYTNFEMRLVFSAIFTIVTLLANLTTKSKDNDNV